LLSFQERGITPTERMTHFVAALRAGLDDDSDWFQEYCCTFISTAENFFPPELYQACVSSSADASIEAPLSILGDEPGECFLGIDIGRKHDRTVFWLDRVVTVGVHDLAGREAQKRIATTRVVRTLMNVPFDQQVAVARELLTLKRPDGKTPLVRRGCIDATGMGAPIAESLNQEFGHRIEPVVFTAAAKEDMAFRTLRLGQGGQLELPDYAPIRRAFNAVKKLVTAQGNIRFDADRTDAGHADEFWAKSLADLAADQPAASFEDYGSVHGEPVTAGFREKVL
jgi:phage FluMu gp28-like protein